MKILTLPLAIMLAASLPAFAFAQSGTYAGADSGASSGSQAALNYAPTDNYAAAGSRENNNVSAPDVIVQGNDVCTTADGVSASGLGFSLGAAISPLDKGCDRRLDAQWLWNMNQKAAAIALLCQDASILAAMTTAGTPCPGGVSGPMAAVAPTPAAPGLPAAQAPAPVAAAQPRRVLQPVAFGVPTGPMTTEQLNEASAASLSTGG
jgi:hypothetical protein